MNNQVVATLLEDLGSNTLIQGDALCERAKNHWSASATQALVMVRPRTTEQVSRTLAICHHYGQPVITQGGPGKPISMNISIFSRERMITFGFSIEP